MSTIKVDTIKDTNNVEVYTCKAWVNFDGTTASINASGNVSSITDNGTGDYTITFTNAFSDNDYSVSLTSGPTTGATSSSRVYGIYGTTDTNHANYMTTTSIRTLSQATNAAEVDQDVLCVAVFR
jgi:hypothetical protein